MKLTIEFPVDPSKIAEETKHIRAMIDERTAEIKLLRTALSAIQDQCKHKHPDQGYNERDGSWANPCIHCGYSY